MLHRTHPPLLLATTLTLLLAMTASTAKPEPADLVLTDGQIVTLDPELPQAEALAAIDQRIVALGTPEEIAAYVGPDTEVVDLEGRLAVPGLIEGHGHFLGVGLARMQLALAGAESWDEIVAMVHSAVAEAEPGQWIEGRGWHQEKWFEEPEGAVDGLPRHDALSAASPDNPVVLRHASGHAVFANAKAMELAGVDATTPNPEGGEIVRDEAGAPIGVFRETAAALVARSEPVSEAEIERMAELAAEAALENGITSFHDAGTSVEEIAILRRLAEEGRLPVRLYVMIRDSNEAIRAALPGIRVVNHAGGFLTVRAIKHSIDGALGSHGAWLLEPYADLPSSTGLNTTPVDTIEESAAIAAEHGLQLCVHAIGTRANRETLDLFARAFADHPDLGDHRWRVEHAQHLHPDDVGRFAELGAVASMQPVHCTSDGPWVPERLGPERAERTSYLWRDLIDSGALVTSGTDAPVEPLDPVANFHAAVTRQMADGEAFFPSQAITRGEALHAATAANAFAAFEEHDKGTLSVGKLADVTVLSRDILTVPEDEIRGAEVVYTVVGGEVRYSAP